MADGASSGHERPALAEDWLAPPKGQSWIDLRQPSDEEREAVGKALNLHIPSLAEMEEIESSSRIYERDTALYVTMLILCGGDSPTPKTVPVTFILTPAHLVTVRYDDPTSFKTFVDRCGKQPKIMQSSELAFVSLLETIVDRAADILEIVTRDLDQLTAEIFANGHPIAPSAKGTSALDLDAVLRRIGLMHVRTSRVRESLLTLLRGVAYFGQSGKSWAQQETMRRIKVIDRDLNSLAEHDTYVSSKISFLLDATLGMINNRQNQIIKIFSVVAVVFMPPTLVASIYGMNFRHMPELDWPLGYPMALCIMLGSAILPYLFFKRKKWL